MKHYRMSPKERYDLTRYTGNETAPACGTGDGHYKAASKNADVDCPACLRAMRVNRLAPLTDEQTVILRRYIMKKAVEGML